MALREIIKDGDPVLRKNARPVTVFDEKLWDLLDDMYETMVEADGVGLAAPQISLLRQIVVIEIDEDSGIIELINPEIVETSGTQKSQEGCLSCPNRWGYVDRPMKVKVKAQDRFGKEFTIEGEGHLAACFCHEIDHLNGTLFIDKVSEWINPKGND